ncbi:hypothetical protein DFH28DRAFT_880692 [Melampsora americana]|nr:hypothetical protein DFH28DRAFT_880692 [Melampsora americana]
MAEFVNVHHQDLDIPDEELPIGLGQVYLPCNVHKLLHIKDGEEVIGSHAEVLQLKTCFHPLALITGNLSNPQTLFLMFQFLVLPWNLNFESMDYKTNIMKFSTK